MINRFSKLFIIICFFSITAPIVYWSDSFSIITNSDKWDYIWQWKNRNFSDLNWDKIIQTNSTGKSLEFKIENFDIDYMNFGFWANENLKKWLYYPAKRFAFRDSFNWIDIYWDWRWCNEILWWFYVHEYELNTDWTLKKAAIDFVQYCEKWTSWLYWSFRYNSSVQSYCNANNCNKTKEFLKIQSNSVISKNINSFSIDINPNNIWTNDSSDITIKAIDADWQINKEYTWDVFLEIEEFLNSDDYSVPYDWLYTFTTKDKWIKVFSKWLSIKKEGTYTVQVSDLENEDIFWKKVITVWKKSKIKLEPKELGKHIENVSKIFLIKAYSYNADTSTYSFNQYWSAVLIWKKTLITNYHVISDQDWNPNLNYEACQTTSEKEPPKCFSTLKLIKYDKNNDLAMLEISWSGTVGNTVTISSKEPKLWDKINILWYPSNWWNTITITQWSIAWFQNWLYKTDSNLDEWNSGWWAFDQDNKFIWIPTFVVNWQTTLWYIIPIKKINDFLSDKGWTKAKKQANKVFDNYIKNKYKVANNWKLDNLLFSTKNFKSNWLDVSSVIEKWEYNMYNYNITDKNSNSVDIYSIVFSQNFTITKYINANINSIRNVLKQWDITDVKIKQETKKIGNIIRNVFYAEAEDILIIDYIQTNPSWNTFIEASIVSTDKKEEVKELISLIESISLKSQSKKIWIINIAWVKFTTKWNIWIFKLIWEDWLWAQIIPENEKFVIEMEQMYLEKWENIKESLDLLIKPLSDVWYNPKIENRTSYYTVKTDENWIFTIQAFKKTEWNRAVHMYAKIESEKYEEQVIKIFDAILK